MCVLLYKIRVFNYSLIPCGNTSSKYIKIVIIYGLIHNILFGMKKYNINNILHYTTYIQLLQIILHQILFKIYIIIMYFNICNYYNSMFNTEHVNIIYNISNIPKDRIICIIC